MLSDNDDGALDVEGVKRVEIYLNYTIPTSKSATTNYPLRRVFKVDNNLDRLAFQVLKTRSNAERKPTFDFYNHASDYKGNKTEVESDTKGEKYYEKHTEIQTIAIMSSEKASNPKDKLEGTYPSRVWGLPPFNASIYLAVMLILSLDSPDQVCGYGEPSTIKYESKCVVTNRSDRVKICNRRRSIRVRG
jgi:hypothetical protein